MLITEVMCLFNDFNTYASELLDIACIAVAMTHMQGMFAFSALMMYSANSRIQFCRSFVWYFESTMLRIYSPIQRKKISSV